MGSPVTAATYDCSTTLVPDYLREIPVDPNTNTYSTAATGYYVCQATSGGVSRVYVIARGVEVFDTDGGCEVPGTTTPAMCVSG
ncbi:hypothetical protein IPJ72_05215 [Candidatus Peregrinibacteria bacterium]|nr:MAG: hypothetical protein IPJ72_05215 [Candidatus Peregrinibacteria bacterium]